MESIILLVVLLFLILLGAPIGFILILIPFVYILFTDAVPLVLIEKFMILAVIGFSINAITGIFFIVGDPDRYLPNIAFRIKMVLIVIAGLNVGYYLLRVRFQVLSGSKDTELSSGGRLIAALSLVLWTSIIVLGRIIPYVED